MSLFVHYYTQIHLGFLLKSCEYGEMVRRAPPRPPALPVLVKPTARIVELRSSRRLPLRPDTHPSRARPPPSSLPRLAFYCVAWVPLLALLTTVGPSAGGTPPSLRPYRTLHNASIAYFHSPPLATRRQLMHSPCFHVVCSPTDTGRTLCRGMAVAPLDVVPPSSNRC